MDPQTSRRHVEAFLDSGVDRGTLGLVYGRRRIGKSTLLQALAADRSGFYWEATRGESAVHLARLGDALGAYLGVGRIGFSSWEEALTQIVQLGAGSVTPVVLDEFGYVLEADPTVDSVLAAVLGAAGRRADPARTRMVLCGSAIAMMRSLTSGEAALRGRAGLELVMQPHDFRDAAKHLPSGDLDLAARVYAVIGGVIGYATDMVDFDLPNAPDDFARWVVARVLSPAATLNREATTLLAEDPTLSAGSPTIHHSILGAIANGAVTAGTIGNQLRRSVSSIDPPLKRLISAGFVVRHSDPVREQRPTYSLADPFLQFHYAILEPHGSLLRDRDPGTTWERKLAGVFDARVRGPVFEEQARVWVRRFADPATLGGYPDVVGPSTASIDGKECQLDIVAASDEGAAAASERQVLTIGEAKAGEMIGVGHLRRLEKARVALGTRAAHAKLMLCGSAFSAELERESSARGDVELVGLDRLYHGS